MAFPKTYTRWFLAIWGVSLFVPFLEVGKLGRVPPLFAYALALEVDGLGTTVALHLLGAAILAGLGTLRFRREFPLVPCLLLLASLFLALLASISAHSGLTAPQYLSREPTKSEFDRYSAAFDSAPVGRFSLYLEVPRIEAPRSVIDAFLKPPPNVPFPVECQVEVAQRDGSTRSLLFHEASVSMLSSASIFLRLGNLEFAGGGAAPTQVQLTLHSDAAWMRKPATRVCLLMTQGDYEIALAWSYLRLFALCSGAVVCLSFGLLSGWRALRRTNSIAHTSD